jgi:uncharacterized membrane protein
MQTKTHAEKTKTKNKPLFEEKQQQKQQPIKKNKPQNAFICGCFVFAFVSCFSRFCFVCFFSFAGDLMTGTFENVKKNSKKKTQQKRNKSKQKQKKTVAFSVFFGFGFAFSFELF